MDELYIVYILIRCHIVDPDQALQKMSSALNYVSSDLGLDCLLISVCPNTSDKYSVPESYKY